jgi:O-antigen/teichoic acid export membrane protein
VAEARQKSVAHISRMMSAANVIIFVVGIILGLLLIVFAPLIAANILRSEGLVNPLRIAGVYLLFNSLTVLQLGVLAGFEAFRAIARINLFMGLITLPVLLTTTYLWALNGTLIGLTMNLIINWFLNRRLIRKKSRELGVPLSYRCRTTDIIRLLRFSYPLAIKEIIYSGSGWLCIYLLLIKTNYGEVGVFNSANQLSQLTLVLPASILSVFLSLLASQADNQANVSKLVKKNILFNVIVTTGVGGVIALLGGVIYRFYGVTYAGGELVLYILVAATIPMSIVGALEQVCISKSMPIIVTYFQFIIQFLIIVSLLVLFYFHSAATSLAFAYLIGYLITMGLMYFHLRKLGMVT